MPTVPLAPFERVAGTPFTARAEDIVRMRGEPWRRHRNEVGLNELDYGDVVYRFEDCGRLEEVTLEAQALGLGPVVVPFGTLAAYVREHDPACFERGGFLVSPALGLAFDPTEPFWVTALARHCLPQWEALRW